MKHKSQKGIAHLALILLLVVAAVIAFAGYKVVNNRANDKASTIGSQDSSAAIENDADLDNAQSTLNSEDVDSALNPDELNSDIEELL